ncbi:MAG: class I tRNA ligase family protein [bacterium]|nr:class I tRNA ligase family protein [bacterium]
MATEPAKAYDPNEVEDRIYRRWEASGFFNPDKLPASRYPLSAKSFSIVMPPPNASGALHIGNAVFVTLEDVMIRYQRMRGKKALWLPGTDHAGFEAQVVFDKKLEKEGRRRSEIPREQFYQEMLDFAHQNRKVVESQLRKLGASCDWSREKFTLDPDVVKTVTDTFVRLYDDGLLYRGERIVNWCVKHQTTLSDLEVKYEERTDPLYYMKYGPLELATVRPETKFGDTAVAVHPSDRRYKKYIGREIEIETLLGPAKIKIIADAAVDPKFGTGVIKVTPAHDPADFEIGKRHALEVRPVIGKDGRLNEKTGTYAGLKVTEAREKVAADMQRRGLLVKTDPNYKHNVAVCYKCGNVVEPLVMPQWFIATTAPPRSQKSNVKGQRFGKSLRDLAVDAVKSGEIQIIPKRYEKVFFHWMRNLRDWNISRQIVWGIRIPAWFCTPQRTIQRMGFSEGVVPQVLKGKPRTYRLNDHGYKVGDFVAFENSQTRTLFGHAVIEKIDRKRIRDIKLPDLIHGGGYTTLGELLQAFRRHYPPERVITGDTETLIYDFRFIPFSEKNPSGGCDYIAVGKRSARCPNCGENSWRQDPDVLDTWFSSGQWPFATLGYPNGKDYKTFYPTDVMETGYDILFFWVARMIMLGLWRTGKVPFRTVYLHGLVRDKDRQKMSKSKGNVIDPLGVAELYGTDAVRMALVIGNLPGQDVIISEEKIRGYRNFANKLWNIHRFILLKGKGKGEKGKVRYSAQDKKRFAELKALSKRVTGDLERFRFHHAAETLYHYTWHTFADKIIESAKPRLASSDPRERVSAQSLLITIHSTLLKLLHPFMPFVTEELWQDLQNIKVAKGTKGTKGLLMVEPWPV